MEQRLFEIEIFYNSMKVIIAFDQFNASLLKKS